MLLSSNTIDIHLQAEHGFNFFTESIDFKCKANYTFRCKVNFTLAILLISGKRWIIILNVKQTILWRVIMNNIIKELRRQNNMTQEELATSCGVSRQTIISLENGKYNPSIYLAHKIAVIFDSPIEKVFIFEEE